MIVLLSPSKTLNPKPHGEVVVTQPEYLGQAEQLVAQVLKSKKTIAKTLGVSEKLGQLNLQRFIEWQIKHQQSDTCTPAAWTYRGETFFGLSIDKMTPDDQDYAQDHVRIVTGLYGLLKPFDLMQPYRLEMGTRLKGKWGKNLYEFWADSLSKNIDATRQPILNCSSIEYSKAVLPNLHKETKVITAKFLAHSPTGLKSKMAFAKYSRGLLARWVIESRVTEISQLKNFNVEGYEFSKDLASQSEIVFVAPEGFSIKGRFTTL